MGVSRRVVNPVAGAFGSTRRNIAWYFIKVVTTTSGTISAASTDTAADCAVTVVKTATKTGRYTFTLPTAHKGLAAVYATVVGAADAAYGAATLGLPTLIRNDAVSTAGTFDLQFVAGDTNWSDAEVADAASFMVTIVVRD